MLKTNFGLLGVAGYIAPRHLNAIKNNKGDLIAALDINDSVGILDNYFDECKFFNSFERFERFLFKNQLSKNKIDYMSICSPNHLHDTHIRFSLYNNCNVICEKPIVLYPHNIEMLDKLEKKVDRKVFSILQLRYHPNVKKIKKKIENENKVYDIDLTYITARGPWYQYSWKGDDKKSGGITTNIGVHFFDLLSYIFGSFKDVIVHVNTVNKASGYLELEKARVRWFLSVDKNDLPEDNEYAKTFRSIKINEEEFDLSYKFDDLHDICYREIMDGRGFGLDDVRQSIEIVSQIRTKNIEPNKREKHPLMK